VPPISVKDVETKQQSWNSMKTLTTILFSSTLHLEEEKPLLSKGLQINFCEFKDKKIKNNMSNTQIEIINKTRYKM